MFDTYVTRPHATVNASVTVTEKRAPTDESVKLLRDMEKSAKSEVIKAVRIDDNKFNGVVHKQYDAESAQTKFILIYSINGNRLTTEFRANHFDTQDETIRGFIEKVAHDLAVQILKDPLSKVMSGF